MLAPVALFVYNRPDHVKATLDSLARNTLASKTKLFVFSDGAKTKGEGDVVEAVRKLAREIVGFASVTLVERQENMGLARSIINGVTELFDQFDTVIVLEDDLVTSKNFLAYMNDALNHYRHDQHAFSVTGHTFPGKYLRIPSGYPYDTYAGYRCSSWSWGTWRDRWQRIDWEMRYFTSFCQDGEAQEKFNRGGQDMTTLLQMQNNGNIDSWAIRFCYAHYANEMRCIYPIKTLVKNIGLDHSGIHGTPNPRFQHSSFDDSWMPRRLCPASKIDPVISREFRAIFDTPVPSYFQLIFRKITSLACIAFQKARGVRA
jgi:hypothetical protein